MDLSSLSTKELQALSKGDYASLSDDTLRLLAGIPVAPPEGGFVPAFKSGVSGLKQAGAALAGRTGIGMTPEAADKYIAEQKEYQRRTFAPTQEGFLEAPLTKTAELFGGSLPYIAAPIAAGAAALALPEAAAAAPVLGGLASALQFTGTGLSRQVDEGKKVGETNLGAAALASIPQAALDMVSFKMMPGLRQIFKAAGQEVPETLLKKIATQGTANVAKDYALATGKAMGTEGITEAAQQFFERMQAGLNLTDPAAQQEYWNSLIGGAVLGGTLAPAGRFVERGREQDAAQKKQATLAAEQAKTAAAQQATNDAATAAQQQTPEYREQLQQQIATIQEQYALYDAVAKDKTQDKVTRDEARSTAQKLTKQMTDLNKQVTESKKAAGIIPTADVAAVEKARPQGYVVDDQGNRLDDAMPVKQGYVVDDQGNLVKTTLRDSAAEYKKSDIEEEAAAKVQAKADKTAATLQKLRDKDFDREEKKQAKREQVGQANISRYVDALNKSDDVYTQAQAEAVKAKQEGRENQIGQDIAINRMQLVLDRFGLKAAGLSPEERATVEGHINEGTVNRTVTSVLGIKGLGGQTVKATDAVANINARIEELEAKRQKLATDNTELMQDDGTFTPAGYTLVANEAKLKELKRLRDIAAQQAPEETPAESMLEGSLQTVAREAAPTPTTPAENIPKGKGSNWYKVRADEHAKDADRGFSDLVAYMDDVRRGRVLGPNAKGEQISLASSTPEGLLKKADEARAAVVDSSIKEVAHRRMEQGKAALSQDEAIKLANTLDAIMQELIVRQQALPRNEAVQLVTLRPAQMRGTELVQEAKTALIDPRPYAERQFGAPQRAVQVLAEMAKQATDAAAEGTPPVTPTKTRVKTLLKPTDEYVSDTLKDLQKVLDLPKLTDDVRSTLDEVQTRMEQNKASDELVTLVDEQVGRILRGTDRPFELERDVTKPGNKAAIAGAGEATLVNDIKEQMRADDEVSGRVEETGQKDLFPGTTSTERTTPERFNKFLGSKEVQTKRAGIAAEKAADAKKIAAEKAADAKKIAEAQKAKREAAANKKEVSLASQIADQRERLQDLTDTISAEKKRDLVKEEALLRRELKRLNGMDASIRKQYATGKISYDQMNNKLRSVFAQLTKARETFDTKYAEFQKKDAAEMTRLDGRMQLEFKFLKTLEKRAEEAKKGTPEQRAAKQAASVANGKLKAIEAQITAIRDERLKQARETEEFMGSLPITRVTQERIEGKAVVTGSNLHGNPNSWEIKNIHARRRILNIRSREDIDASVAERQSEKAQDELAYRKELVGKRHKTILAQLALAKQALKDAAGTPEEKAAQKAYDSLKKDAADIVLAERIGTNETSVNPRRSFIPDMRGIDAGAKLGGKVVDALKEYTKNGGTDFRVGTESGGVDQAEADARGAEIAKGLPKDIKFEYYATASDMPADLQKDIANQGLADQVGFIRGGVRPDGTVFVVGGNHTSLAEMEKTIAHEFVGHYSLEGVLGTDGMLGLLKRVESSLGGVFNLAESLGVNQEALDAYVSGKQMGLTDEQARVKALSEVMAYTAEKRVDQSFLEKAKRWMKELVGAAREAFRKMGLIDAASLSSNDLFYLLKEAHNNFKEGLPVAYKNADGATVFAKTKTNVPPEAQKAYAIAQKIVGHAPGTLDKVTSNLLGFAGRVQYVDRAAALEELLKRGVSRGMVNDLKAADAMYFMRMSDQRNSWVSSIASNGAPKLVSKTRPDGRAELEIESGYTASLAAVSKALQNSGYKDAKVAGDLFTAYLAAERSTDPSVGRTALNYSNLTDADIKELLALGRDNKAFQEARKLYNEYNKGMIDFLVSTGALSKELGAKLNARKDYIPYYRTNRNGEVSLWVDQEKITRVGDTKNQKYLKELVGDDEKIMDFFTSSLRNTSVLTDMALRNLATRNVAFAMEEMGVLDTSKGGGGIYKGSGPADETTIRFYKDGVEHYAQLSDEAHKGVFDGIPPDLIIKGMEGIQTTIPFVIKALGMPATILRKFITRDPRYAMRQVFRDSMTGMMTTGADIVPVLSTMKEVVQMMGKNKSASAKALERGGVLGGHIITGMPEDMQKIMQQMASGKIGWATAMAKLDSFAMAGDAATRVAMYNSFLKQGLSEREAKLAALESMNFSRRGISPSIHMANTVIPFFNASIQGLDVMYRAMTNKMPHADKLRVQRKLLTRGLMITAGTIAYAAAWQDDDAYKNAKPEQKYANWFVNLPGIDEPFKVPIPFELGILFKAIPEGVVNAAHGDDAGKIFKALALQTANQLPGNLADGPPLPTAIKPILEVLMNRSLHTGQDIVGGKDAGVEPFMQYGPHNTEAMKSLGAMLNVSPAKLDYLINGYTGALGVGLLSLLNPALKTGGEQGGVEGRVIDMPFVGTMFQPNDAGTLIDDAYNTMADINAKKQSFDKMVSEGDYKEAESYMKENAGDISLHSFAGKFKQQMGKLTVAERAIRAAPPSSMSPAEKRKGLDTIRQAKIVYAKQFSEARAEIVRQTAR